MITSIQQQFGAYPASFGEDPVAANVTSVSAEGERTSRGIEQEGDLRPNSRQVGSEGQQRDKLKLSQEAEEVRKLQVRDREVRAHEAAHASVGGSYAGAPTYSFERGPDGQVYAVGGEVSINVSPISGDPEATLMKARQVRAAALAPAEPSAQDMRIAQRAQAMEAKARQDLAEQSAKELKQVVEDAPGTSQGEDSAEGDVAVSLAPGDSITPPTSQVGTISRLDIRA